MQICPVVGGGCHTLVHYIVKHILEIFNLQEGMTTDRKVSKSFSLAVRAEYIRSMKAKTIWYWVYITIEQIVIVSIRNIDHPRLDVSVMIDVA